MNVRNLIEFTVDMQNKNDEIVKIINVYLSQIQNDQGKKMFLEHVENEVQKALNTFYKGE